VSGGGGGEAVAGGVSALYPVFFSLSFFRIAFFSALLRARVERMERRRLYNRTCWRTLPLHFCDLSHSSFVFVAFERKKAERRVH
jgi:uncharacterized membrane protein YwaF